MTRIKKVPLIELSIPGDEARKAWSRIQPFVEKYHQVGAVDSHLIGWPKLSHQFGIKELCLSVYTQGLRDCMELVDNGHVKVEDGKLVIQ